MVIACQVKEIQICTELRKMAEMGLIPTVSLPRSLTLFTSNCFRPQPRN